MVWASLHTARAIGGTLDLSADPRMAWFTTSDGMLCPELCLLGITPRSLNRDALLKTLRAHPLTRNFAVRLSGGQTYELITLEGAPFTLIAQTLRASGSVELISVEYHDASRMPQVGAMVAQYGAPTKAVDQGYPLLLSVGGFYDSAQLSFVSQPKNAFTPDSFAHLMRMHSPSEYAIVADSIANVHPWRGFAYRMPHPRRLN
ncbi:MAG: hypothetical protein OHK0023_02140 [Anaerolineae bacterium]